MPGKVIKVLVNEGDVVEAGQSVIIIEAMKMQSEYKVKNKCVIKSILTSEGETINADQTLITLETYTEE
jgi:biotin carboxyl carrier protein